METVQDKLVKLLVNNGMFDLQAKEIINLAIPIIEKDIEN